MLDKDEKYGQFLLEENASRSVEAPAEAVVNKFEPLSSQQQHDKARIKSQDLTDDPH